MERYSVLVYEKNVITVQSKIVHFAPRARKETLLKSVNFQYESQASAHESETSTENTRVDKVPLPRGAYAIFYNTCVISDILRGSQIFWSS